MSSEATEAEPKSPYEALQVLLSKTTSLKPMPPVNAGIIKGLMRMLEALDMDDQVPPHPIGEAACAAFSNFMSEYCSNLPDQDKPASEDQRMQDAAARVLFVTINAHNENPDAAVHTLLTRAVSDAFPHLRDHPEAYADFVMMEEAQAARFIGACAGIVVAMLGDCSISTGRAQFFLGYVAVWCAWVSNHGLTLPDTFAEFTQS